MHDRVSFAGHSGHDMGQRRPCGGRMIARALYQSSSEHGMAGQAIRRMWPQAGAQGPADAAPGGWMQLWEEC